MFEKEVVTELTGRFGLIFSTVPKFGKYPKYQIEHPGYESAEPSLNQIFLSLHVSLSPPAWAVRVLGYIYVRAPAPPRARLAS